MPRRLANVAPPPGGAGLGRRVTARGGPPRMAGRGGRAEQEAKRPPAKNGGRGKLTQGGKRCLIIYFGLCFAPNEARNISQIMRPSTPPASLTLWA